MGRLIIKRLHHEVSDTFSCGNASIDSQIRQSYFESLAGIISAFEILSDKEDCIGYTALQMKSIHPEDFPSDIGDIDIGRVFAFYAVEIKFLAVNHYMQGQRIGTAVLEIFKKLLLSHHKTMPFCFIYVDALAERKSWYTKHGFIPFEDTECETRVTIPMYLDLVDRSALLEYLT